MHIEVVIFHAITILSAFFVNKLVLILDLLCSMEASLGEKAFVQSPNDEWTASDDDIALFEFPALVETLDDREIGSDDDIILA